MGMDRGLLVRLEKISKEGKQLIHDSYVIREQETTAFYKKLGAEDDLKGLFRAYYDQKWSLINGDLTEYYSLDKPVINAIIQIIENNECKSYMLNSFVMTSTGFKFKSEIDLNELKDMLERS